MADLKYTYSLEDIAKLKPFFKKNVPNVILSFLVSFMESITNMIGFSFAVVVPDEFALIDEDTEKEMVMAKKFIDKGIIESFHRAIPIIEDEPFFTGWVAQPIKKAEYGGSIGAQAKSSKKAMQAMLGESLERWSIFTYDPGKRDRCNKSTKQMKSESKKILDPKSFTCLSKEARSENPINLRLSKSDDTVFEWVKGKSIFDESDVWIPYQTVSFSYEKEAVEDSKKEPRITVGITTGAASGQTKDDALLSGLSEIIERDAFMIYWLNSMIPVKIDPMSIDDEEFQLLLERAQHKHLEIHLLHLETDAPIYTVLCVIIDTSKGGHAVSVGASARANITDACKKATLETFHVRSFGRVKYRERQQSPGVVHNTDPKKVDQIGRILYWADQERIPEIQFLLTGKTKLASEFVSYENQKDTKAKLDALVKFMQEENFNVAYVNLITQTLSKELDMFSIFCKVPGFQALYLNELIPCHGSIRLKTVPKKLGKEPARKLNEIPHPFS